ncbi:hypothetical protein U9M48_044111 [Paspalum notatum var. saurae]|uniref:Uncharacterized protein n=1 Tax=Paspalum notatum var. saurae TaxID=547442 RepID=A0AAQ3XI12_PASNO
MHTVLFGRTITKYMETKTIKAQIHNARLRGQGRTSLKFHARDRSRRGVREREDGAGNRHWKRWYRSLLLHEANTSTFTMLTSCRELSVDPTNFVSTFYTKGAIAATWNQELFGYGMVRAYTHLTSRNGTFQTQH